MFLSEAVEIKENDIDFYFLRTLNHIQWVQQLGLRLIRERETLKLKEEDCRLFFLNLLKHDKSKFNEVQYLPYKEFTWFLKNQKEGDEMPIELKEAFEKAKDDHFKNENHHLTMFKNDLSKLECLEMACDFKAMSIEFKQDSALDFFENNWKEDNKKFAKDEETFKLICNTVEIAICLLEAKAINRAMLTYMKED